MLSGGGGGDGREGHVRRTGSEKHVQVQGSEARIWRLNGLSSSNDLCSADAFAL